MIEVQIASVEKPFDRPEVAYAAFAALSRAEAMGLLQQGEVIERLDWKTFRRFVRRLGEVGIAKAPTFVLAGIESERPESVRAFIDQISRALEESPVPEREWRALVQWLGVDVLAQLLRTSSVSVRRYARGDRRTPDKIADRLHWLAMVVGDLAGTYNAEGVRRWFQRARAQLEGRSPAALLGRDWNPDHDGPRRVRSLAHALTAGAAT